MNVKSNRNAGFGAVLACAHALVLSAGAAPAASEETRYVTDKEGEKVIWQEQETPLPAFPREDDLVRVHSPPGALRNAYFVDIASIALGEDRVLRYTVVVRSAGGAVNAMHEGLACEFREVKTYAYGSAHGQFKRVSNPRWQRIASRGARGYQGVLAEHYFCDEYHAAIDREAVLSRFETAGISVPHDR